MRARTGTAALCALAILGAPAAGAATRPCITDAADDMNDGLSPTGDPSADLRSVDVTSVGGRLTATLKLAGLDPVPPVMGHRYDVYLSDGETTFSLTGHVDNARGNFALVEVNGPTDGGAFTGTDLGPLVGRIDTASSSIVMSVERQRLGFGTGRRITVTARSWRSVGTMNTAPKEGQTATYWQMDDSDHAATHRIGKAGCTK